MTFTKADVPEGPYFHGTRQLLPDGTLLRTNTVNPSEGDNRTMVWATTDVEAALAWANLRYPSSGDTLYVYKVDLIEPEVDTNRHRDWETGPFISVMAPVGTVVRLVRQVNASDYSDDQ